MKPKIINSIFWSTLLLFLGSGLLVGCAGGFLSSSSSTGSSSNDVRQGPPPSGAGQAMAGISGVITQYNASQKTLTIRTSNGTTRVFSIGQATIEKSQAITRQTLKTLLTDSKNMIRFTGQKSASTTYTAQEVTVMAMNASNGQSVNSAGSNGPSSGGNPPGNNGTSPAGGGPMPNGTPPVSNGPGNGAPPNGTPPTGGGGTTNATPPAGNGNVPAGNGQGIMLQNVKMQNNQLLATTFSGQSITVNLVDSTKIVQQVVATTSDLKAGLQVSIMQVSTAQNSSTTKVARTIIIESILQ
jgi:hypothetical protein